MRGPSQTAAVQRVRSKMPCSYYQFLDIVGRCSGTRQLLRYDFKQEKAGRCSRRLQTIPVSTANSLPSTSILTTSSRDFPRYFVQLSNSTTGTSATSSPSSRSERTPRSSGAQSAERCRQQWRSLHPELFSRL